MNKDRVIAILILVGFFALMGFFIWLGYKYPGDPNSIEPWMYMP